jgi:hypothetical protein
LGGSAGSFSITGFLVFLSSAAALSATETLAFLLGPVPSQLAATTSVSIGC